MAFPSDFSPKDAGESRYILNKLEPGGKIKFRILSDFITGWAVWGDDSEGNRICTRVRQGDSIPAEAIGVNRFTNKPESVKQFIAATVYNYESEQLEILETNKSTIIKPLFEYDSNEEYGDARSYDITISRQGEGKDTEYSVIASPPKDPKKNVLEAYNQESINLEALYDGADPFAQGEE